MSIGTLSAVNAFANSILELEENFPAHERGSKQFH